MSDPVRLFESSDSALERQLLGVARAEKSSSEARAKTLAALGITGTAALSATAVGAMATRASVAAGKTVWAKLLIGLSAAGAIAIAPPVYRAWQRHQALGAHATAARSTTTGTLEISAPLAEQAAAPVAAATLARELAALDAARTAVAHQQPRRALALLEAYTRAYPDGTLAPEAEILHIDALSQGGQGAAARRHAEAFVRRHPNSVLAARARQYLAD
jgi:hypothetical protein